ncbi:MAG: hypothetical protein JWO30_2061, partial [Fibrobacteres bacterium]|nr:hypothetical protein [Fibrobacterota bacterium]
MEFAQKGQGKALATAPGREDGGSHFAIFITICLKFHGRLPFRPLLLLILLPLLLIRPAFPATRTWDNGGADNLWTTAANWSGDVVPGSSDAVVFDATSVANCYFNSLSTTVASVTMSSAYTGKFQWGYAAYGKGIRGQYYADNAYTGATISRVDAQVNFPSDWTTQPTNIGSDTYRVLWHGWVLPAFTETYTFYETSDDGGKLWVNGNLIIDQFNDGGMVEFSGTAPLTANQLVEVKYEYYENVSGAGAELRWSSPSLGKQLIPQNIMFPDRNGLAATWYDNNNFTGTSGSNVVPWVNFDWGGSYPSEYVTGGDDFSASFTGYVEPLYTETYTFYSYGDDRTTLWVNDQQIINTTGCCGEATSTTINLIAGVKYAIRLDYRELTGSGSINLSWSSASQAKEIIPNQRLYVPYTLNVTGNVDLRSGGLININAGNLVFTGGSAQTFIPKSGMSFARITQNGAGGTTVSTNDLTTGLLQVVSGTFNLGTGRTVTPDYLRIDGGSVNFGTSDLYLSQGTIDFSSLGSATSGTSGADLILNGTVAQTLVGTVTGAKIDVTAGGTQDIAISGILATGTGAFTKSGSGILTLSGANTFSGGFTQSGSGVTNVNHNTALGSGGATMSGTGKIVVASGITAANALTFNNCDPGTGRGALEGPGSGTGTWGGTITVNSACASGGHLVGGGGRLTVTGAINSASLAVVARDMNLTLSGGGSYPFLSTGTSAITIGAANGIATNAVVDVGTSGGVSSVDLNGFNQTIAGLKRSNGASTATVTNSSGTATTLTINSSTSNTYPGVISGNTAVTMSGSGTEILSGTNTYTGGTNIAGGTLSVGAANNLGSPSGTYLTVFTGTGTLAVTGSFSTSKDFWLNDGVTGTFDIAAGQTLTANGPIHSLNGCPVYKAGSGTMIFGTDNAQLDNDIYLTAGTIEGRTASSFGNTGWDDAIYASAGTTVRLVNNTGVDFNNWLEADGAGVNVVIDRVTAGAGVTNSLYYMNVNGAYTVNVSAGSNVTSGTAGYTILQGGTLFGNSVLDVTDPGTPDLLVTWANQLNAVNYNMTFQGTGNTTVSAIVATGSGTVTKAGSGTLLLSGANTYTGATTVSAGTLKLGSATALGTTAAGTSVTSGAVLDLNGTNYSNAEALTLNGTGISSGGALINGNATGATYAGLVTLGSASSILGGTGTINLSNTGTITGPTFALTLGGAQGGTIAGILGTTTGTLAKQDAGTWTLNGTSTRTNVTTLTAGTLVVTTTTGLGSGSVTANGATLQFLLNGAGNDGTIAIGNNFTNQSSNNPTIYVANNGSNTGNTVAFGTLGMGNSTLNVTGANGYKVGFGAVTLTGGVTGTSIFNPTTADLTLASLTSTTTAHTAQLDGTSTGSAITGVIADNGAGTVTLTKAGAGIWTLPGTNTYTGTTTANAGTLNVTGSLAAGSAVTVASGGTLAGTGTVSGTVAVSNGGIVAPGNAGIGTLSTGAKVLNASSVLNYTLSPLSASTGKLAVTGNFTLDGTVNVTAGTAFTFGTYTLATYSGTLTNNTLNVGTLPNGYFGTITAGSGAVTLNILDYTGWTYVSTINFNTTSSGANVPTDVANFPLLVRLDSNNFFFDQAMPDGRDIRFADPDGTPLAYEIERWDATLKKAEIWVLVPQVDGNSDRDFINCYWGNPSAATQSSPNTAFPTSAGFSGVWHLDEDGNTTAAGYGDATSNAYTGTGTGLSASSDVSAQVGIGQQFDGSTSYITVTGSYPATTTARTFSLWAKSNTATVSNSVIAAYGTYPGSGGQVFGLAEWSSGAKFGSWTDGSSNPSGTAVVDQSWHHLAATYDGATVRFYQDGSLAGSGAVVLNTGSGTFVAGARMNDKSLKWNGIIDEMRVSSVQRSADWIKLEYENQRTGGKFLAYPNTALSTFSYNTKVYINTTASGANITTPQSNYPLLIRLTNGNFNFAQARSDGGDLRFADGTGALLSYEIERFDAVNKLAEIWVSVPTVYGNNNSQWFNMYWGKAAGSSLSSGAAVFSAAGGYAGVWHLNEDGSTTALAYKDASGLGNNGTGVALTNTSDVTSLVGIGTNFATASNQGVSVPSTPNLHPSGAMTIQVWLNSTSQTAFHRFAGRPFTSSTSPYTEFDLEYDGTATKASFSLNIGGTEASYTTTSTMSTGNWYLLAGVYDGAAQKVYLNGAMETSAARSGSVGDYAQPFSIGKYYHDNNSNFDGKLDEVRLSTTARSTDWMKLDYESMKAASTVVTVGTRTPDYTNSTRFNFNTTATGA